MVENLLSTPYTCLWITMLDGIYNILNADYFTFIPGLTRFSQNGKLWSQYEIDKAFSRDL